MNDTLKSIIENKISSKKLKITRLVDSEETVCWIPLISFGEHQTLVGLTTGAMWVIEEREGLRILDETWKFVRLLVFLEQPRRTVYHSLKESLEIHGIFIDVNDIFPFDEIVKIGFEQKSEYWAELALDWFIDLPQSEQKELLEFLIKISDVRWASQKLRHKVKKEIRSIEKK